MKKHLVIFLSTGVYSGFFPIVAGTIGTIPAWLIAFFVIKDNALIMAPVVLATFVVSVWSAGEAEKMFGHDAKKIVIDEWAGMFVTLLFVPFSFVNYLIGFFAFRVFDVAKVPPASQFENLPRGWGITMDDIAAGIYANLATRIVIYLMDKF